MKEITEKEAIKLLKKYSRSEKTYNIFLDHSKKVRDIALRSAKKVKGIDMNLVKTGALLHDIGRLKQGLRPKEKIKHGIIGSEILRKEGLPKHALIAERHIGIGITKEDIKKQGLNLPQKDYVPRSKEEIIVAYADNLEHFGEQDEKFVEERFARELGEEYRKRVKEFHKKVHDILKKK